MHRNRVFQHCIRGVAIAAGIILLAGGAGVANDPAAVVERKEEDTSSTLAALAGWERCYLRESEHYIVATDMSRRRAAQIAQYAESLHSQLTRQFAKFGLERETDPAKCSTRPKIRVLIFGQKNGYDKYRDTYSRCTSDTGYYHRERGEIVIFGMRDLEEVLRLFLHEATHQFQDYLIPSRPPWLDEGLAEYFEASERTANGLAVGLIHEWNLKRVREAIRTGAHHSLGELLRLGRDAFRSPPEERDLAYAEAWALVHFLLEGERGKWKPLFMDYIERLRQREDHFKAFCAVFGAPEVLERAWLEHVKSLPPTP